MNELIKSYGIWTSDCLLNVPEDTMWAVKKYGIFLKLFSKMIFKKY